jgi:hypothetical protein
MTMKVDRKPVNRAIEEEPAGKLMTTDDFCRWAKISKRVYYQLRRAGDGPIEIRFRREGCSSPRIWREEAEAWARRMTAKRAKPDVKPLPDNDDIWR